ncbi:neo-calmodulin-like [Saccoglossus kowalevskii]
MAICLEFREAFLYYDRFGDGKVRIKEIGEVLKACGENPTMPELHKLWNNHAADGKKTIEFSDFLSILSARNTMDRDDDVREAFRVFDLKGSGYVDGKEIQHVLENLQELEIPDAEIKEMLAFADANNDGQINYEEFLRMMRLCDEDKCDSSTSSLTV